MHCPLPRRRAHDGRRVTHDTDVLVIGAGPAGAVAAWEAKRAAPELDVVLLERDARVGTPVRCAEGVGDAGLRELDRKSTRLNSSHLVISYAVFCLKKKKNQTTASAD